MKKVITIITVISAIFSSYSFAEHTNYYAMKEQEVKKNTTINATESQSKPFITQHLNEDSRINNK